MPIFQEEKIFPFQCNQLYDLVKDIENYPQFIPGVNKATIVKTEDNLLIADLRIGHSLLNTTYRSKIRLSPYSEIYVEGLSGPFEHLFNTWKFAPCDQGCVVKFHVNFKAKGLFIENLVNNFFENLCQNMIKAFEKRAYELY